MLSGVMLGIMEMLIPNGKTEKVVSFAISLTLLVLLLSPLESAMNINQETFDVKEESTMRDEVESALDEGEEMFLDTVEENSTDNIRTATVEALKTVGIEVSSQDVHVETSIPEDLVSINVYTTNFDGYEMKMIEENQSDLEVSIGTIIAQNLRLDRNMVRFCFEN